MLKKLLTLSLALVMLSAVAMASPVTYTLAADLEDSAEEEATVPATEEFDGTAMELIRINQTEDEGVVSQKATIQNWGTAYTSGGNWWILAKINIGENWNMNSAKLTLLTRVGTRGTTIGYYAPITKADYDAAKAIAGTSNTINTLVEPQNVTGADSSTLTRDSSGIATNEIPVKELTSSAYVNSYDGEYLYIAMQFVNPAGNVTTFAKDQETRWKLTVDGKKAVVVPTVPATEEFDGTAMELIRINQTEDEGVVSQKATIQNWGTAYTSGGNWWILAKINIGENWIMNSAKLTLLTRVGTRGTTIGYYAPITKADYDAAKAIAGTSNTINTLVEPQNVTGADSSTLTRDSSGIATNEIPVKELTSSAYVNSYDGEYLYIAMQFVNPAGNVTTFAKDQETRWKLTVDGKKIAPTVDDFSDAVIAYDNSTGAYTITTATTTAEAYLIIASFTGTAMNDVEVVSINAAEGLSGSVTPLDAGTIKIFLLDKATLAPAIGVTEPTQN